jgi:hypothetical protein
MITPHFTWEKMVMTGLMILQSHPMKVIIAGSFNNYEWLKKLVTEL